MSVSEAPQRLSAVVVLRPAWHRQWWQESQSATAASWRVVRGMLREPATVGRRFAEASAEGELVTNPLTVFGATVGLLSPPILILKHLMGKGQTNAGAILLHHFEPYLQFVALGVLCHGVLRLLRATRAPWHTTIGLVFYSSALAVAADLVGVGIGALLVQAADLYEALRVVAAVVGALVSGLYLVVFTAALEGAHGARAWQAILAVLLGGAGIVALRVLAFSLLGHLG